MGAIFILVNCKRKSIGFASFRAGFYIHCFTVIRFREFLKIKIMKVVYALLHGMVINSIVSTLYTSKVND